jgi:hypothetical protein
MLILTFSLTAFAQQYSFRHYGAADGLQNLTVLSLAQDGAGYIWASFQTFMACVIFRFRKEI